MQMGDQKEIACNEVVELATDYLEGELTDPLLSLLESHMTECDGCTEYVDQLRHTVRALRAIPEARRSEPANLDELKRIFRSWAESSRSD
jgi:anti-sigma factor RsiW